MRLFLFTTAVAAAKPNAEAEDDGDEADDEGIAAKAAGLAVSEMM